MADINDNFLEEIKKRLQDVTMRANRLQEWVDLELYVSKLVNSFSRLHEEVRRTAGLMRPVNPANFNMDRWATFDSLWQSCDTTDFGDLEEKAKLLNFITLPLATSAGAAFDPQLASWIAELKQKGTQIRDALNEMNPTKIVASCDEFDKSLKRRVIAHRQWVIGEMKTMATRTAELHNQIVANTPPLSANQIPPGAP